MAFAFGSGGAVFATSCRCCIDHVLPPLRDLGIYSLAIGLVELLWYVPQSVSQVLLPHVASSTEADADSITSAFCRASVTAASAVTVPRTGE